MEVISLTFSPPNRHHQQNKDDNPAPQTSNSTTSTITPLHTTPCTATQHNTEQLRHTTSTSTIGTRLAQEYPDRFSLRDASNSLNNDCSEVQGKSGLCRQRLVWHGRFDGTQENLLIVHTALFTVQERKRARTHSTARYNRNTTQHHETTRNIAQHTREMKRERHV